jgi:isoquinoline 1-oxidoreductase alpha subunit
MSISFSVNGEPVTTDAASDTMLVWVLREHLQLTGTKISCGMGVCGSCTVHVDGAPIRSCRLPVAVVADKSVTTIEGLSADNSHPLQKAWVKEQVPQCGYCQSGQIMQAVALLEKNASPTRDEIVSHMDGNLCRCGTYNRIVRAIQLASTEVN